MEISHHLSRNLHCLQIIIWRCFHHIGDGWYQMTYIDQLRCCQEILPLTLQFVFLLFPYSYVIFLWSFCSEPYPSWNELYLTWILKMRYVGVLRKPRSVFFLNFLLLLIFQEELSLILHFTWRSDFSKVGGYWKIIQISICW